MDKLEEQFLICEALGIDKADLIAHPELKDSTDPKLAEFKARKQSNEPLAYITGFQPFMGLKFFVDKNVLIPRPETELLVEEAIRMVRDQRPTTSDLKDNIKILDIGTGSGCIAILLAKSFPNAQVFAVDKSQEAIHIARKNTEYHEVLDKIQFLNGNLFVPLNKNIKFDIIISNPPYIPSQEIETLQAEVKDFEPRTALDGGQDGLDIIREIAKEAPIHLKDGGSLLLEIGFGQADAVKQIFKDNGFKNIDIINDYAGIERIIAGTLCKN